jgi:hypothetical protein
MADPTTPDVPTPTILGIPLNRIITFVGPYISLAAGVVATWIISVLHVTQIPHDQLATGITNFLAFVLSSGLVWLGQRAWLKGHQIQLANLTPFAAPVLAEDVEDDEDFEDESEDPDGLEFVPSDHSQPPQE